MLTWAKGIQTGKAQQEHANTMTLNQAQKYERGVSGTRNYHHWHSAVAEEASRSMGHFESVLPSHLNNPSVLLVPADTYAVAFRNSGGPTLHAHKNPDCRWTIIHLSQYTVGWLWGQLHVIPIHVNEHKKCTSITNLRQELQSNRRNLAFSSKGETHNPENLVEFL